jgi:hypothetical protein
MVIILSIDLSFKNYKVAISNVATSKMKILKPVLLFRKRVVSNMMKII